jgi:hypothetical protein
VDEVRAYCDSRHCRSCGSDGASFGSFLVGGGQRAKLRCRKCHAQVGWLPRPSDEVLDALEREAVERVWKRHIAELEEDYGRRDPECVWCGRTVYMAFFHYFGVGAVWTTDEADEGGCPGDHGSRSGIECSVAPDGEHSCFPSQGCAERWQKAREERAELRGVCFEDEP